MLKTASFLPVRRRRQYPLCHAICQSRRHCLKTPRLIFPRCMVIHNTSNQTKRVKRAYIWLSSLFQLRQSSSTLSLSVTSPRITSTIEYHTERALTFQTKSSLALDEIHPQFRIPFNDERCINCRSRGRWPSRTKSTARWGEEWLYRGY